jgi:hypothetical protein
VVVMPCKEHVNYQAETGASVPTLHVTLAQTNSIYFKFTDQSAREKG